MTEKKEHIRHDMKSTAPAFCVSFFNSFLFAYPRSIPIEPLHFSIQTYALYTFLMPISFYPFISLVFSYPPLYNYRCIANLRRK